MLKQYSSLFIVLLACLFYSCGSESKQTLKVAATAIPHTEILEQAQEELKKEGIDLVIVTVDDYNTPNRALSDREVDANFFQHQPFLDLQIREFHYPLHKFASIHIEPMGIYSKKHRTLEEISTGAIISIPSDPTNQARALLLLEKLGWITLNEKHPYITLANVTSNSKRLKLLEIDSPMLVRTLDDVDFAAITTNFALQGGFSPLKDALAIEDKDSLYTNILVVREGDEVRPELEQLKQALQSDNIKAFIKTHYRGAILPAF